MPKNNNLKPVQLPMDIRFNVEPETEFKTLEDSIDVQLMDAPTEEELLSYIPQYVNATWAENPYEFKNYSDEYKKMSIVKMLKGKTLPSALETIRFTFMITGITLQEVTHLLRHRTASFSAVCTGDRFMHFDDVIMPESIANSPEFAERYKKLAEDSKKLYADMIDTKEISLMDARYALPKSTNQTYYMSMNYKDLVGFIKQRIDRAIQPKADNIMAYQMWLAICKQLPIIAAADVINFNEPSWFFINTSRTGSSTNLYIPEEHNDKFEWNEDDFIYKVNREELSGTNGKSTFNNKLNYYTDELEKVKEKYLLDNPDVKDMFEQVKKM